MLETKHASTASKMRERIMELKEKNDTLHDDSRKSARANLTPPPKKARRPRSVSGLVRRVRSTRTAGEFGAAEARHQREMQEQRRPMLEQQSQAQATTRELQRQILEGDSSQDVFDSKKHPDDASKKS